MKRYNPPFLKTAIIQPFYHLTLKMYFWEMSTFLKSPWVSFLHNVGYFITLSEISHKSYFCMFCNSPTALFGTLDIWKGEIVLRNTKLLKTVIFPSSGRFHIPHNFKTVWISVVKLTNLFYFIIYYFLRKMSLLTE